MNKVYPTPFQCPASIEKVEQHHTLEDFVIFNDNVISNHKCLNGKKIPQTQKIKVKNSHDKNVDMITRASVNMNRKYDKIPKTKTAWSEIEMNDLSDSGSALSDDGSAVEPLLFKKDDDAVALLFKQDELVELNLQNSDSLMFSNFKSNTSLDNQPYVHNCLSDFQTENSKHNENKTIFLTDITGRTYKMPVLLMGSNSNTSDLNNKTFDSNTNKFKKISQTSSLSRSSIEVDELFIKNLDLSIPKNHIDKISTDGKDATITGSLAIDVNLGVWTSDIKKDIDIQIESNDWSTEISEISNDLSKLDWKTTLLEISQFNSIFDWQTSIKNIKEDDVNHHHLWVSKFADGIKNTQSNDWTTEIKKIEKMPSNNSWTTVIKPIEKHKSKENEWITKINPISKNTNKDSWKVNLPSRLKSVFRKSDWKMHTSTCITQVAKWEHEQNNIKIENHPNDWSTACTSIEPRSDSSIWNSNLSSIEPIGEDNKWIIKVSDLEKKQEKDIWNMNLTEIEKNDKCSEWNFYVKDVPNNEKQLSDWLTTFKSIDKVFPEENLWLTIKNDILSPNEFDSWSSTFYETDVTDMSRSSWKSSVNDVLIDSSNDQWKVEIPQIKYQ
ncbi:uncharacterized protein LOC101235417 isoform X3 [Hydra vulgaris]|uniref:uncharacterized protein LOC101235417 isoform X3 n=1 Tax=Hydra vulgaris TaxID=6087 RepID=UPI001F5EED92|nr:uncharacterized protein LOC101235417 isoform X3 [Hydra vulgaris]